MKTKFDETHKKLEEECSKIVSKTGDGAEKKTDELKVVEVDHLKGVNGISDFWFKAIKNNNMIFELVKEKDEEILKHIRHIESERTSEPKSLTVKLHFEDNEFFENKEPLTLTIYYKGDDDDVDRIEGT